MLFGLLFLIAPFLFISLAREIGGRLARANGTKGGGHLMTSLSCGGGWDNRDEVDPRTEVGGEAGIFRLADAHAGRLTLSDVIVATDMTMHDAEALLNTLVDELHVRMEVEEDGSIVYEFPELMRRHAGDPPRFAHSERPTPLPAPAPTNNTRSSRRGTC